MTRDDIIRMAREAGLEQTVSIAPDGSSRIVSCPPIEPLERFATLVAAAEREACAEVCENGTFLHDFSPEAVYSRACARAIRARGLTSLRRQLIDAGALQSDPAGLKARGQV